MSLAGCLGPEAAESLLERAFPGVIGSLAITSITPESGPIEGGTEVTIRGTRFEPEIGVLFGEQAALSAECVNEGLMRATTPPQDPGTVAIVLVDPYGREVETLCAFTYLVPEEPAQPAPPAPPMITSIEPDHGPVGGGTPVTITGSGFGTDVGVLFGALPPLDFAAVNDSLITAITPAHEEGPVDVTVFDSDGGTDVRVGGFTFLTPDQVPLVVDSIAPSSGPADGGTQVTIEGSGFVIGTAVFFGARAATDVAVVNDGVITANTAPHAEDDVLVTVRTPDGREATCAEPFTYYFGRDSDGDGLSDIQETEGWDIWVDYFGIGLGTDTYGNFPGLYSVTSDPDDPDTDGDGLDDYTEFLIISDPRKVDTDEDGLDDAEEVNRWHTSPITVDTDGDCRGPSGELVPNANLFDGAELGIDFDNDPSHTPALDATSPTLADTDGDGRTDWEEFDHPWRSAVIADLPAIELEIVDEIDIRLDVEYAEEQGQSTEYGTTVSESTTETSSWHTGGALSVSAGMSFTVGAEIEGGFPKNGVKSKLESTLTYEIGYSQEWQIGGEHATTLQNDYSEMQAKSRTHTETAASGSISTGIVLANTGPVSVHLTNLG